MVNARSKKTRVRERSVGSGEYLLFRGHINEVVKVRDSGKGIRCLSPASYREGRSHDHYLCCPRSCWSTSLERQSKPLFSLCRAGADGVVHEEMTGWRWNAGLPCGSARLPVFARVSSVKALELNNDAVARNLTQNLIKHT